MNRRTKVLQKKVAYLLSICLGVVLTGYMVKQDRDSDTLYNVSQEWPSARTALGHTTTSGDDDAIPGDPGGPGPGVGAQGDTGDGPVGDELF